jgi:hypothetical protein
MEQVDKNAISPTAWVTLNSFVNETQEPLEFKEHRFLIKPFSDLHPDLVVKKSAQVGFSVTAILKSIWLCKYMGLNIIYALPTNDIIKGFVQPKVDTLIASNPQISELISSDSMSLKQINERFIHFKGTGSQREAISTSADLLVVDEFDRALDMNVVSTFDSRLQYSKFAWRWRFSNPSQIGFGVDSLYQDSDQMHWFIKCKHCTHEFFIDFDKTSENNHYIDQESENYVCGKCSAVLDEESRRLGRWIAKYPSRARRGYWISQLMAPWVPASRILEQKNESNVEFFYNFVLGKAFTPSDLVVNRQTILRACAPSTIPKINVVIGVDQNVNEQIYVMGTPQGIFAHGRTKSWEELENLKLKYNALIVCDPMPYPTMPKQLATKYDDFYMAHFKIIQTMDMVQWKGSDVYADRTRLLDLVANEIESGKLLFREHPQALEDYIADWNNIYRTTVEKQDGRTTTTWLKKENKESDFSLATAYYRLGLSRSLGARDSRFFEQQEGTPSNIADMIGSDEQTILEGMVEETMAQFDD